MILGKKEDFNVALGVFNDAWESECKSDSKKLHHFERIGCGVDIDSGILFTFFVFSQCRGFVARPHKSLMKKRYIGRINIGAIIRSERHKWEMRNKR